MNNPNKLLKYPPANRARRHAPGSIKVHLAYGRLTLQDLKKACDALEKPKLAEWKNMPTSTLKRACKEIRTELRARCKA